MGKKHQIKEENKNTLEKGLQESRQDGRIKKRRTGIAIGFLIVIATVVVVFLFGKNRFTFREPSEVKAFQVGDNMVYMDEVNFCILENVKSFGIDTEALGEQIEDDMSADEYYKQKIMDAIMDYKVEARIAKNKGLSLTEEDLAEVNKDVVSCMESIDGGVLRKLGITQDKIMDIYKERYLAQKLEEQVVSNLETEDVSYCTMYMLLFPKVEMDENGDYVRKEDTDEPILLSDEEIDKRKAEADAAYDELQNGADIEEIAKKYGVEVYSGAESNTPETFGEPFSEYAKTLKEGEISPVIDILSCYAILKMMNPNDEEVAEQIMGYYRSDLEDKTIEENRIKWYDEVGVSKDETWTSSAWKKVTLYDFVGNVEE